MKFRSRYLVNFLPDPDDPPLTYNHYNYSVASEKLTQIFDTRFFWIKPYIINYKKYNTQIDNNARDIYLVEVNIPDEPFPSVIFGSCITQNYGTLIIYPSQNYLDYLNGKTTMKTLDYSFCNIISFPFKNELNFKTNIQNFKDFITGFLNGCIQELDTEMNKKIVEMIREQDMN